jgi:hypothetical protein
VAGIHAGRLAAIHAGRGEVGVALTIHELEVLTKRSHLELPGVKSLKRGFRLLPASAYPDGSPAYLGGQHPGGVLPGAVTAAAHFPGVDLRDGYVPAPDLMDGYAAGPGSAELAAAGQTRAEPIRAEPDRSSASWWEKSQTQAGPTRPS